MRPIRIFSFVFLPLCTIVACGGLVAAEPPTPGECTRDARVACSCANGTAGFRPCTEALTLGECSCGPNVIDDDASTKKDAMPDTGCVHTARFYVDADKDGFGSGAPVDFCMDGRTNPSPPTGYSLKGGDCDDENDLAFPGQTEAQEGTRKGGLGDFNCDGVETKLFEKKGSCSGVPSCTPGGFVQGWETDVPPCGTRAPFITDCSDMFGACEPIFVATSAQRCL